MKQSCTLVVSVLFALAAAMPLEMREYTSTIIEDVTETVDVYTTVYVAPGDPRLTGQFAATQTPSSAPVVSLPPALTTPISSPPPPPPQTTSQAPAIIPQQKQEKVEAPAPTSTPVPSVTPQPVVQAPKVEAPAPVVSVTPVQASSAPAPSQTPPSAPASSSGATGAACGQIGGKCIASDVTTFDGGLGSCGYDDATKPNYFALAHDMMGTASNDNPNCGRTAKIVLNGKEFDATLTDKCMGCTGASIDLSLDLFNQIFPTAGGTGRFHDVEWYFTS